MMIAGVDPGAKGGFAFIDGESVIIEPMPLDANGQLDLKELNRLFRHYADQITCAYLEQAQMRAGQGGQVSFIRNFGILEGMLACLNIPTVVVQPATWSKEFDHGVVEKNIKIRKKLIKVARRGIVNNLYPGIDLRRTPACKIPDEGMVDALLIATYGWNKHKKKDKI